jgi:GntR family transcriptional regulator/MocR family aminotransferase
MLPSSRALAAELGVSRSTVTSVYELLVAEGWLATRPGATTTVAAGPAGPVGPGPVDRPPVPARGPRHDFDPGSSDPDAFPLRPWTAALRRALAAGLDSALVSEDLQGLVDVRARLVEYLARARGVVGTADDLVVCSGFAPGLALLATTLLRHGVRRVAVEDPCHPSRRDTLTAAGLEVWAVPVDGEGLRVDLVPEGVDAVVVTPVVQFPTGAALSAGRRRALVALATERGIVVVEDDVMGDLRYGTRPRPALQSLAPERVAYLHSAAAVFTPGLRLGWLVVPPVLRDPLLATKRLADGATSVLEQLALGGMLADGTFFRHLRRQRDRLRRRRDHLTAVLGRRVPQVRVRVPDAGLFVVVELPPGSSGEDEVVADATARGMRLRPVTPCWRDRAEARRTLAVGFAATADHNFRSAVDALAELLADHTPGLHRPGRPSRPSRSGRAGIVGLGPVLGRPVPAGTVPTWPVPAGAVPGGVRVRPVPAGAVPGGVRVRPVPAGPVPARAVPCGVG